MTPEDVLTRVKEIEAAVSDPEMAHIYEDNLRADILRALADGVLIDAQLCAQIALKTDGIDFPRWCA